MAYSWHTSAIYMPYATDSTPAILVLRIYTPTCDFIMRLYLSFLSDMNVCRQQSMPYIASTLMCNRNTHPRKEPREELRGAAFRLRKDEVPVSESSKLLVHLCGVGGYVPPCVRAVRARVYVLECVYVDIFTHTCAHTDTDIDTDTETDSHTRNRQPHTAHARCSLSLDWTHPLLVLLLLLLVLVLLCLLLRKALIERRIWSANQARAQVRVSTIVPLYIFSALIEL